MKKYSTFPKSPGLEPHRQTQFSSISRTLVRVGGSYFSTEMQSAYFTVRVNWASQCFIEKLSLKAPSGKANHTRIEIEVKVKPDVDYINRK